MTKSNGTQSAMVRLAIAGVGSCASSFVQLLDMASADGDAQSLSAIPLRSIGGYSVAHVQPVIGFDVDRNKVGCDLATAIRASVNAAVGYRDVPPTGAIVEAGPLLDGLRGPLSAVVDADERSRVVQPADVARKLRSAGADVLVCFLPTGARTAVQAYAEAAASAGVAFVNATPEPVATSPHLQALFQREKVPLLGDDLRSHLGATAVHTALLELFESRAISVRNTYQLNFGGNHDFLNMSDPPRAAAKCLSKRAALTAAGIDARSVSAGPNGYVPHLGDTKVCYLRIEGDSVLGSPVSFEVRLQVEDSPNAAAVVANAVRVAKASMDRGYAGVVDAPCAFLFKNPRVPAKSSEAAARYDRFITHLEHASALVEPSQPGEGSVRSLTGAPLSLSTREDLMPESSELIDEAYL